MCRTSRRLWTLRTKGDYLDPGMDAVEMDDPEYDHPEYPDPPDTVEVMILECFDALTATSEKLKHLAQNRGFYKGKGKSKGGRNSSGS